jgi:uncharacterized membrane protein YvbJ
MKFISKLILILMIMCSAGFMHAMEKRFAEAVARADFDQVKELLRYADSEELETARYKLVGYLMDEKMDPNKHRGYLDILELLRQELKKRIEEIR